jgi:hypothetical protein
MDATKDAAIGEISVVQATQAGLWIVKWIDGGEDKSKTFKYFADVSQFVEGELLA